MSIIDNNGKVVLDDAATTITDNNGYDVFRQAGVYYGLSFIEKLMNLNSLKLKVKGVMSDFVLSRKVLGMNTRIAAVMAITKAMPVRYDRKRVQSWVEGYNKCFKID